MSRLLYPPLSAAGTTSPFDECALQVARSGSLRIVSPYIGVGYLERLTGIAREWQLISDIEAWLSSLSLRARPRAWSFIREHIGRIHHCPSIHAKVVLSDSLAMLGSANLTSKGILGRTEMGILLDAPEMVLEMRQWFEGLWQQTASPIVDETNAFVLWLDEQATRASNARQRSALSAATQRVRSSLAKLETAPVSQPSGAPLPLAAVAQALLADEQRHYDSLEHALTATLDALAIDGFTLDDAIRYVRAGFPGGLVREIYLGLLRYTANHVRSVFAEDTVNRVVLSDGRFQQSTRESVPAVLARFDEFLVRLLTYFSFDAVRECPSEAQLEKDTGFPGRDQVILFAALLECGYLVLDDQPGSLPGYLLDATFEWSGRYKLFATAAQVWSVKLARRQLLHHAERVEPEYFAGDTFEPFGGLPDLYGRADPDDDEDDRELLKLDRMQRDSEAEQLVQTQQRRELFDSMLATILTRLFSGEELMVDRKGVLAARLSRETHFDENLLQLMLTGRLLQMPAVLVTPHFSNKFTSLPVALNPTMDWDDLVDFPKAKKVCADFLGMPGYR